MGQGRARARADGSKQLTEWPVRVFQCQRTLERRCLVRGDGFLEEVGSEHTLVGGRKL